MKKYYEISRGTNTFVYVSETNKEVYRKDTIQVFKNIKDALINIIVQYPKHRFVDIITGKDKNRIDLKDPHFEYQDIYSRASMIRTKGTGICKKPKCKATSKKPKRKTTSKKHKNHR